MLKSNYAFATGKIRFLENKLLDSTDLDRMLEAKDAQAVFKVFNDTSYADELQDIKSPAEFREILNHDLKQTKDLIFAISPDKRLIRFLCLRFDFHNIKLFFKAKYLNQDLSDLESHLGTLDVAVLKDAIINDAPADLGKDIAEILEKLKAEFGADHSPQNIDSLTDTEYFGLFKKTAVGLGNSFIKELAEFESDMANLKLFLRLKNLGRSVDQLKKYFIPGGRVPLYSYVSAYEAEAETGAQFIQSYFQNNELEKAIRNFQENKDLPQLELAFDNTAISFTRRAKYLAYGPEVIIQYFYSKMSAQKNVRIIMVGKINEIEREEIAKRVRKIN